MDGQHNPNAGEGTMKYDSSASRSSTSGVSVSAGVEEGLSMVERTAVKEMGDVTQNQRPKSMDENIGNGMKLGC